MSRYSEALPLVAFCLEELHRHVQPRKHLTKQDYDAIGGLRGAIGKRLDDYRATIKRIKNPKG